MGKPRGNNRNSPLFERCKASKIVQRKPEIVRKDGERRYVMGAGAHRPLRALIERRVLLAVPAAVAQGQEQRSWVVLPAKPRGGRRALPGCRGAGNVVWPEPPLLRLSAFCRTRVTDAGTRIAGLTATSSCSCTACSMGVRRGAAGPRRKTDRKYAGYNLECQVSKELLLW